MIFDPTNFDDVLNNLMWISLMSSLSPTVLNFRFSSSFPIVSNIINIVVIITVHHHMKSPPQSIHL